MCEWYIENKCTYGPAPLDSNWQKIDPEFENMHCLVALPSSNWFLGSCHTQIHDFKGVVELHQTPLLGSLQQISICFNGCMCSNLLLQSRCSAFTLQCSFLGEGISLRDCQLTNQICELWFLSFIFASVICNRWFCWWNRGDRSRSPWWLKMTLLCHGLRSR